MNTHTQSGLIKVAIAGIVIAGAAFWGGMAYAASKTPVRGTFAQGAGQFAGGRTGASGFRGGGSGAAFGTIIAKDATSITVALGGPNATSTNGTATGSKIVLVSASTQIGKFVSGTAADLSLGQMVTVAGTPNSDGSISATTVQIRPTDSGRSAR